MIKGNLTRILNSNLYYVNISWTPNDHQQNQTHLFCYTAINSDGIQNDQICVKFFPGIFPPKPINLLRSANTKWSIFFNKKIQRPSIPAFISFYQADTDEQVHKIDTSSSTEVIFAEPNQLSIAPNYFFTEKQKFYVKFEQGIVNDLEGCHTGNEPLQRKDFWTFISDLTPPDIDADFTLQPSGNKANIYFSWVSNEPVIWQCEIMHDLMKINASCSEGSWKGFNLPEGKYILKVEATDEAINKAIMSH